ncbi:pseudouridine synthase [Shewanella intestini]|uniref:Pseudouridine synthase n=1 Tax=Shewanella intestini TaxID=2017544 RepID=A0ABS5I211_9GAMM|nr:MULTISPECIES: pseudouridine synthase [Shewanella]MBR9727400.1 pseudouridine synthase [Shewanella intestini]MRG35550.1 pseudouridine synthase [Shewanella sp. XMDDZSB0408]
MRLDKFVCKSTSLSRTNARDVISQGQLSVNKQVITDPAFQVHENNTVMYQQGRLTARPSRYFMLHKPLDTLSSNVDGRYPSVLRLIDVPQRDDLHIVGRLDADTSGLLLLTDDGRWSFDIIRPLRHCNKTYHVSLRSPITEDAILKLTHGVQLQNESQLTRPATVEVLTPKQVLFTITEGKYHQVKRMFAAVGNRVNGLHRVAIGSLQLDVDVAQWRELTHSEIHALAQPSPN